MRDHIHLLEEPKLINLKQALFTSLASKQDKQEYVRKHLLIPIKTMRLENIMFYIIVPAELENIPDVHVYFFNDEVGGSSSSHVIYLRDMKGELNNDKKIRRFKILDTGRWPHGESLEVNFVAFTFRMEIPENDFEFKLDVYHKWTYKICADGMNEEFWFNDGRKHHEIGDNFSYRNQIELTVRDEGAVYPYLLCSATGRV